MILILASVPVWAQGRCLPNISPRLGIGNLGRIAGVEDDSSAVRVQGQQHARVDRFRAVGANPKRIEALVQGLHGTVHVRASQGPGVLEPIALKRVPWGRSSRQYVLVCKPVAGVRWKVS